MKRIQRIDVWSSRMEGPQGGNRPMWMLRIGRFTVCVCPPWTFKADDHTMIHPIPDVLATWNHGELD